VRPPVTKGVEHMLKKILFYLDHLEENIIALFMTIMVSVLTVQVFARYVLSYGFSWAEQLTRILFVWITLAGVSLAAKRNMHLKVEAITNLVPERIAKIISIAADVFTIVFSLYIAGLISKIVLMQLSFGQVFPSMTWLPVWTMYLAGVFGMIGMAYRTFERSFWPLIRNKLEKI
jgi:TRAP-type C4-dicarboxylate transport system permease small subunit